MINAQDAYRLTERHESVFTDVEKSIISRAKAGHTSLEFPLPYGFSISSVTERLIALGYSVSHNKELMKISWKPLNKKK